MDESPVPLAALLQAARAAQTATDAAAEALAWRRVRETYPDEAAGYLGGGLAARRTRDFEEADAIYAQAIARLPEDVRLLDEYGWSARERGDDAMALQRWQRLRERFPNVVLGHLRIGVLALQTARYDRADVVLAETFRRFPGETEAAQAYAWVAHERRDWREALRRWEFVVRGFPLAAVGRWGAAHALAELGREDEAAVVLGPALRMFPQDERIATLNARLATARQSGPGAEAAWRALLERFPANKTAIRGLAAAQRAVKHFEEADQTVRDGARQFPDDPEIAMELARIDDRRQDWPAAVEGWRAICARFPTLSAGCVGLVNSLYGGGDATSAIEMIAAARARFPLDFDLAATQAELLRRMRRWPEAIEAWSALRERFSGNPGAAVGLAHTLRDAGEFGRSAQAAEAALRRFPDHLELQVQLALTLSSTGDSDRAVAIWEGLQRRYPGSDLLAQRAHQIREEARRDLPAGEAGIARLADAERNPPAGSLVELFRRFQSIGTDCEFALVQRVFGSDAPSLLRWSWIATENLVRLLETDFAGVGEPRTTAVRVSVPDNEYVTEDARYAMLGHTFTPPATVPLERFADDHLRRMRWLREKMLHDLASGGRIFVHKAPTIEGAQIAALDRALRRFNPRSALLVVRLQRAGNPAGSVERVADRLVVGHLDRFSVVDISVSRWVDVCRLAAEALGAAGARTGDGP